MCLRHKMTTCVQCLWYNLIFFFCWAALVTSEAEDLALEAVTADVGNISTSHDPQLLVKHENEENEPETAKNGDELLANGNLKGPDSDVEVQASFDEKASVVDDGLKLKKQVFAEATSQNSGLANEMTNSGLPVVVTLSDLDTAELQHRAILSSQKTEKQDQSLNQKNQSDTKDLNITTTAAGIAAPLDQESDENIINNSRQEKSTSDKKDEEGEEGVSLDSPTSSKDNLTEEIPSFSEWTQKRLEEAEKKKEPTNGSAQQQHNINGKQGSGAKLRWKNYASLDCGAKVVASNPEAISPSAILSPSRDEYILNTCTSRIWFVVELCEAIQAKKIDFANFELFSSTPKDFTVSISDRFPTREWSAVGQFTAKDERDIQSFDLHPHLFGKYIKVEVKSHYGSEHYCPMSLFRVYGTSEFEVLQKEDPVHADRIEEEEDDDDESLDIDYGDSSKNLFSSATDAVISIVKKAAEVLGNKGNHSNHSSTDDFTSNAGSNKYSPIVSCCTSPSHLVVCNNCTDTFFGQVFELLSCRHRQIANLVAIPWIRKALINSNICQAFGFDSLKNGRVDSTLKTESSYVKSVFPKHYLAAMCNSLAIFANKIVLNVTSSQYTNVTTKKVPKKDEDLVNIETSEVPIIASSRQEGDFEHDEMTDVLSGDLTDDVIPKFTCSTEVSYASQIKPTKTLSSSELNLKESSTETPIIVSTETSHSFTETLEEHPETVESTESKNDDSSLSEISSDQPPQTTDGDADSGTASDPVPATTPTPITVAESSESLDEHLERFINEFNGDSQGGHIAPAVASSSTTPQAQKESVFLRLSNRIKALERNMSLSGQYLEELSKRYKKQVEEMQKLLDKTVLNMKEEIKKKNDQNKMLEEHLRILSAAVEDLVAERKSWLSTFSCAAVSTFLTVVLLTLCNRRRETILESQSLATEKQQTAEVTRRQSIDVVQHGAPKKKKRRPSDQALKIVRSSITQQSCAVMDDESGQTSSTKEKKKKKKMSAQQLQTSTSILNRSNSVTCTATTGTGLHKEGDFYRGFKPSVTSSKVWNTHPPYTAPIIQEGIAGGAAESVAATAGIDWVESKQVDEIPFVLEESEHSTLELVTLPADAVGDGGAQAHNNNGVFNGDNANKVHPPPQSFVKTALNFRRERLSLNGGVVPTRKSISVDETRRPKSTSPAPSAGSITEEPPPTPKKERKGLKKIFKKVF